MASLRTFGKKLAKQIRNEDIKTNLQQAIPFWFASLLTGLIAIAYTQLFALAEKGLQTALGWNRAIIFLLAPVAMLVAWLVVRIAVTARGSGIPQVMAAIDLAGTRQEHKLDLLLNMKVAVVKIVSSMFMVVGGAAVGREGPTIQIAGSVFRTVNKFIPSTWPQLSRKSFILTGAAAGLAAAFNTPLGGIVFAIEELAKIHLSYFRTALFTAVIIAGLTAQSLLGPYLYLGYPDVKNLPVYIFGALILTAIIAGVLGAAMAKIIVRLLRWRRKLGLWQSVGYILLTGLVLASVAYFLDEHILGSGKELMNSLLFTKDKDASIGTVAARFFGPILSFNVGAAGGVFAPSLATGAAIGGWVSGWFNEIGANANILVLAGMVAFLTGVTRTPFTSAILVLEMTDRHSVIFHLMLAALVSSVVSLVVDKHSFYDHLKKDYLAEVEQKAEQLETDAAGDEKPKPGSPLP